MYESKQNIEKRSLKSRWLAFFLAVLMFICCVIPLFNYTTHQVSAEETTGQTEKVNNLKNGSFEAGQTWTSTYNQPDQSLVPDWNTTAFQGKIELFRKNKGIYINNVELVPSDGDYAAELNADEESTLYQVVKTSPSSIYEWGLDHGARNGTDTMALIIGPKQSVNPSKPSKAGRDQFMQMVDWLIAQGKTSVKTSAGMDERLTVYSKKFAKNGAFEDNAGNNAFSLTPSTIYTEEWHIWIMSSSRAISGTNPWNSYGSNSVKGKKSSSNLELDEYYHYTVPAGQTDTIFGFVSVGVYQSTASADKAKTFGNFIDNINFELYHPLSASTTIHGSAVIGGSDGTASGEGSSEGHKISINEKFTTYVTDGEPLRIQAVVKKEDADSGCEFVGIYYTYQDENGNPEIEFLQLKGNEIEDTGGLTEEKKGKWIKSTKDNGDIVYTYYLTNLNSSTDLHFLFVKSPTITYDPNGGKDYVVDRTYNTEEAENVYSFKPVLNSESRSSTKFIEPYKSHAAEGQNSDWKFMGWKLTGDTMDGIPEDIQVNADKIGSLILPAEHTIACDYSFVGVNEDSKAQYFKIYNGNVNCTETINKDSLGDVVGVTWNDNNQEKAYANVHKGLTMVAQWRWRQSIKPQTYNNETKEYDYSDSGGTVEFTNVTDKTDNNYNDTLENGSKSYFAELNEKVIIKATANQNYSFIGWYDENNNLIATNDEYTFVETKEGINNLHAKFSNSVTQTYIRQVGNGDNWEDTADDKIGTLGRYEYTDAVGMPISSTAIAGNGYKFMGWYDSSGNKVGNDMLTNNGATLNYTTSGNATYYARFSKLITQKYQRKVWNSSKNSWDNTSDDTIGTLTAYTKTDVAGVTVNSTATAGSLYDFKGWYDSGGNLITENKTLSNAITNATYYARFSKKTVTQTFIRQLRNGSSWENIADDDTTAGTLDNYGGNVEEIGNTVSSTATAKSGYRFVGWYDSAGKKVSDDMLTNNGATISYTTTGNATYYARFEKAFTLNVNKIDGDKSTGENKVPLAGAEFTLYQKDSNGDKTIVYGGTNIKCTAVRTAVTALNENKTQATAVFGAILSPDTEYYLAETKAPTGYRLLDSPLKITFDDSGNVLINEISKPITDNVVDIELANYLALNMPVSGTMFSGRFFAVAGISLLSMAVIGLFFIKKNRLKSKNKI